MFGGYINGVQTNQVYIYNITTNQMTNPSFSIFPEARSNHSAVIYQNSMYVYGGNGEGERLSDFWKLDLINMH